MSGENYSIRTDQALYIKYNLCLFTSYSSKKMSSCGSSSCNCGSSCKCGSGCSCAHLDLENTTTATIIVGVAPMKSNFDGAEMSFGSEGGNACKCGSNCTCDPCNC